MNETPRSWFTLRRKKEKFIPIHISTLDSDIDFNIQFKAKGSDLFELVCKILGIRESWFFGLQFKNYNGDYFWLRMNKKIVDQCMRATDTININQKLSNSQNYINKIEEKTLSSDYIYSFDLLAKYYPEDIEEIIQNCTLHLFFLQVSQQILSMELYCPPEASILLASYALQAKYGNFTLFYNNNILVEDNGNNIIRSINNLHEIVSSKKNDSINKNKITLSTSTINLNVDEHMNITKPKFLSELPPCVLNQYQMTETMWVERILTWYKQHDGISKEDAEMEYLKIVQDLDMYGIQYFEIINKKKTDLWLGVSALGLNIYEKDNKLTPKIYFPWNEIRTVSVDNKKFTIKLLDKNTSGFVFYANKTQTIKLILELCVGNHDLFLRRRKPDSLEIQQMKIQAREEKSRKQAEKESYVKDQEKFAKIEKIKNELQQQLENVKKENERINHALKKSEETTELLAEKSKLAQEESYLLAFKAKQSQMEIEQLKSSLLSVDNNLQGNGHILPLFTSPSIGTLPPMPLHSPLMNESNCPLNGSYLLDTMLLQNQYLPSLSSYLTPPITMTSQPHPVCSMPGISSYAYAEQPINNLSNGTRTGPNLPTNSQSDLFRRYSNLYPSPKWSPHFESSNYYSNTTRNLPLGHPYQDFNRHASIGKHFSFNDHIMNPYQSLYNPYPTPFNKDIEISYAPLNNCNNQQAAQQSKHDKLGGNNEQYVDAKNEFTSDRASHEEGMRDYHVKQQEQIDKIYPINHLRIKSKNNSLAEGFENNYHHPLPFYYDMNRSNLDNCGIMGGLPPPPPYDTYYYPIHYHPPHDLSNFPILLPPPPQTHLPNTPDRFYVKDLDYSLPIHQHQLTSEKELQLLSGELEKERTEYVENCKTLRNQLVELRKDFETLKVTDKESALDRIHAETQNRGDNKYSTLKKIKTGTMKSRVDYFEEL